MHVCSRASEDVEAGTVVMTTWAREVDNLKRTFSARVRSATSPLQQKNQDNENKIHALEAIVESQHQRDQANDQKIAELEKKFEAAAHAEPKETPEQRQHVQLQEERISLLPNDKGVGEETENGRSNRMEIKNRLRRKKLENTAQVVTPQLQTEESMKEPSEMSFQEKRQFFEKNEETPVDGRRLPTVKNRHSCIRRLSFGLKRKPSQSSRPM